MIIFGVRSIFHVIFTGMFFCPRCQRQSHYNLIQPRRWFTLFFIPIFPYSVQENHVHCTSCNSDFFPEVLKQNVQPQQTIHVEPVQSQPQPAAAIAASKELKLSAVSQIMDIPYLYRKVVADGQEIFENCVTQNFDLAQTHHMAAHLPKDFGDFAYSVKPFLVATSVDGENSISINTHFVKDKSSKMLKEISILFYEYGMGIACEDECLSFRWDEVDAVIFTPNDNNEDEFREIKIVCEVESENRRIFMIQDDMLALALFGVFVKFVKDCNAEISISEGE